MLIPVLFAFLASCNATNHTPKPDSPVNVIRPSHLSAEQQEIIDLLSVSGNQELMLFDFDTVEAYKDIEVWVEIYRDGALVDRPAGVGTHSNTAEKHNGHLAITVNLIDSKFQWILSLIENGAKSGHIGSTEAPAESGLARAYGPIGESVEIEDGKEMILYSSVFSGNDFLAFYDGVTLQERPELLREYPYVYLVKAKFAK